MRWRLTEMLYREITNNIRKLMDYGTENFTVRARVVGEN